MLAPWLCLGAISRQKANLAEIDNLGEAGSLAGLRSRRISVGANDWASLCVLLGRAVVAATRVS